MDVIRPGIHASLHTSLLSLSGQVSLEVTQSSRHAGWFGGPAPGSGPALERLTQGELSPQQVLEHQSQLLLAPQKDMHIYLSLLSSPRGCHTKEAAIQPSPL